MATNLAINPALLDKALESAARRQRKHVAELHRAPGTGAAWDDEFDRDRVMWNDSNVLEPGPLKLQQEMADPRFVNLDTEVVPVRVIGSSNYGVAHSIP